MKRGQPESTTIRMSSMFALVPLSASAFARSACFGVESALQMSVGSHWWAVSAGCGCVLATLVECPWFAAGGGGVLVPAHRYASTINHPTSLIAVNSLGVALIASVVIEAVWRAASMPTVASVCSAMCRLALALRVHAAMPRLVSYHAWQIDAA